MVPDIEAQSMSKNTSIVLGKEHDAFIQAQVKSGRFGSASEAMRAGIRLLEEQELKVAALRAAIITGEKSGPATAFNMDDYIAKKRRAKT
jgi:antitoxin ParD1/3/4